MFGWQPAKKTLVKAELQSYVRAARSVFWRSPPCTYLGYRG